MQDFIQFQERRNTLISHVKQEHGLEQGVIVLAAAYEPEYAPFRQDSTFYYFTGIQEPACVCLIWLSGEAYVYVPDYPEFRSRWVVTDITHSSSPHEYKLDGVYAAGVKQAGIAVSSLHDVATYQYVAQAVSDAVHRDVPVCACVPDNVYAYVQQKQFLQSLEQGLSRVPAYYDISPSIGRIRRKKSRDEVAHIHESARTTIMAHEAAACAIEPEKPEYYVQAAAEYIITECGARPAFPSVIASGRNSTILHYASNSADIAQGDLVVVDIGAYINNYVADVTRTYPASGSFTTEQARIYEAVRDTQEYVAELLQPGYYIYNADDPEQSLYHCAQKRLKQHGYQEYFIHNIGHFLGLDVHDVGNIKEPLQEGDVITIEPGVYDEHNGVGVRIEDMYWIINDGAVCLTDGLPREQEEVERLAQRSFSEIGSSTEHSS